MGAAILGLVGRQAVPIGLGVALVLAGLTAWHFSSQRDAARIDAVMATRAAEANAEAVTRLTAEHERHIATLTTEAERARADAARLGTNLEALRRDPSHASSAAPVLRDAVERLRLQRRAGDPAGAAAPP